MEQKKGSALIVNRIKKLGTTFESSSIPLIFKTYAFPSRMPSLVP